MISYPARKTKVGRERELKHFIFKFDYHVAATIITFDHPFSSFSIGIAIHIGKQHHDTLLNERIRE